jgi:outer membrane protein assembly factor BamB
LAILDDMVFATPAGAKGLVVALDKRNGDTVWATPALDGERPSYASPILVNVDGHMLLVNSAAKNAFAVNARTGGLCWTVTQEDPDNTVATIPVLGHESLVITNASRGFGAVYGVRLNGLSAAKAWTQRLGVSHGSSICLDGQVYGASSRGVAQGWVAVDATDGSVRTLSSLDGGSLIFADGRFYCLTQRGTMTLQKQTDRGFETVGAFPIGEGKDIWAHPVICRGRLYLRVHDDLFCYDIRE